MATIPPRFLFEQTSFLLASVVSRLCWPRPWTPTHRQTLPTPNQHQQSDFSCRDRSSEARLGGPLGPPARCGLCCHCAPPQPWPPRSLGELLLSSWELAATWARLRRTWRERGQGGRRKLHARRTIPLAGKKLLENSRLSKGGADVLRGDVTEFRGGAYQDSGLPRVWSSCL